MAFKVNEYFGGNVKSIGFTSVEGSATVGVMAPGEYEFTTSTRETMRIISGSMSAKLPGQEAWAVYNGGESFVVEANKKFAVRATREAAYLCLFG
jgi:purine/pyrimidine-nucleoside phosphorylase